MKRSRVLQLVGSPSDDAFADLSLLYARGCVAALEPSNAYEFVIAHVSPDGTWRFPTTLDAEAIASARPETLARAVTMLAELDLDAALPQLFCRRGMTDYRALLDLLDIPYLGNTPAVMATAADKTKAKAIVAAARVDVPRSLEVKPGRAFEFEPPAVVKPSDADNSEGVTFVRNRDEYAGALRSAFAHGDRALVEAFVPLGREVRCGVVERAGRLVCLPLEEYYVDTHDRPIRRKVDKLKRTGSGELTLVAKTTTESWIVAPNDPIVPAVWAAARACYSALGSRHYNLFDFRIDPAGRPWFLESGPYCSFSPQSVLVTMMEASGVPLADFFSDSLSELLSSRTPSRARPASDAPELTCPQR